MPENFPIFISRFVLFVFVLYGKPVTLFFDKIRGSFSNFKENVQNPIGGTEETRIENLLLS